MRSVSKFKRDIGQHEDGQRAGQFAHVAHGANVELHEHAEAGQGHNADQRRWDGLGHIGKEVDDGQSHGDHGIDDPTGAVELGQLGQKDQDGQCVDKAGHHRARDKAQQHAQLEDPGQDFQDPGEDGGGQQIFQAIVLDQRDHDQRHGAGGRRDHARPAADKGDHDGDTEGGIETHFGVNPGDDGKGDGFRDEGQRHDHACQQVATDVAEPFGSKISV